MSEAAEADAPAQDDGETCDTCGMPLDGDGDPPGSTCGTCQDVQPTASLPGLPPF